MREGLPEEVNYIEVGGQIGNGVFRGNLGVGGQ